MNDFAAAVEILRRLRPQTPVRCPLGLGVVMVQSRGHVTVRVGWTVAQFERWLVEELTSAPVDGCVEGTGDVGLTDYTDADLAWFRRPVSEVLPCR